MAKPKQAPTNEPDQDFEIPGELIDDIRTDEKVKMMTEDFARNVGTYAPAPAKSKKPYHEEWTCQIRQTDKGPVFEKLKKLRENITMTEEQAAVLNTGLLHGPNNFGSMYFLQD
jgi:hypothetical protein